MATSLAAAPPPFTVAGNRLTLLPDGPDRLDALIALIRSAERSLRLLYYIWDDDTSGRRVRDALLEAAERGIEVALLVDGWGASGSSESFFRPMVEAGCRFCRFVPRWGRRYLLRNHQKLALADERRVIVGGFNVSDEYFGTVESGAWRDVGLEVEGPGVAGLGAYFDDLFRWAEQPIGSIRALRRVLHKHSVTAGPLKWLFGGPTRRLSPWARSVKNDMLRARRLDMIAAYFAPSRSMIRRICGVARRGRARLVTAGKSDNRATVLAARHSYARLMRRGVEVYEYQATKLHTKLIVIDDAVHIGSANFDMRSLYLNLEMMLRVEDARFAKAMRRFVDGEIAESVHVTPEAHRARMSWWNRFIWSVAHFVVATADYNLARRLNFKRARLGG
ncbi:MAG: phosphatidylserine/phosphatidylglycerophosphate/cardiolipin synthase family protein [Pseudomonadota bacterium]|nr:phosphatidylserine/phosphatidylglycerophosphate/cardiolipin synthase family protein [Pseudomonadota bacterium]